MPINETKVTRPAEVVLDFNWTGQGPAVTFTVGGNTYPYAQQFLGLKTGDPARYGANTTNTNQALVFTATAQIPAGVVVKEYRWDFGDGNIGYGPSVTYTYRVANPNTQVSLTVTDSFGRVKTRSKPMNLRPGNPINVLGFVSRQ
jgi:PKD repeat protein